MKMKGFRTIAAGLFFAVALPGLTYLAGLDWTQYVNPNIALMVSGALTIALRFVTNTSVFSDR